MKTLKIKRVVVKSPIFKTERYPITQLMQAEFPQNEIDLRVSGGYSDIGIQYEIDRGSEFYTQEIEYLSPYRTKVLAEVKIENPTVSLIRERNKDCEIFPSW